jgi:beta-1,4-mannosyl-glycoprotein beta-1,4-N-acetylglucosaminyltransferase
MKLIDGFIFYNEEKMLDFRLWYLNRVVDYFVIVESTVTFSGNYKESLFDKIKDKYAEYAHKIIHVMVEDMPMKRNTTAWDREHHQRECIRRGVEMVPDIHPEDWVLLSDVDEIMDRNKLEMLKVDPFFSRKEVDMYSLDMETYYYNLECKLPGRISVVKVVRKKVLDEVSIKFLRFHMIQPMLYEFGWHFSYFFDEKMIANKIKNFAHQEYNNETYTNEDHISDCIRNKKSLFHHDPNREKELEYVPIDKPGRHLPEGFERLI